MQTAAWKENSLNTETTQVIEWLLEEDPKRMNCARIVFLHSHLLERPLNNKYQTS
jgi:hypothetical protein